MKKYTEDIQVNPNIKISEIDKKKYIGKYFTNNSGKRAKCIGVFDTVRKSIKRYVLLFDDGSKGYAEGCNIKNGQFVALPKKPLEVNMRYYEKKKDDTIEKLEKKIQNLQDKNRILRKIHRKSFREEEIVNTLADNFAKLLSQHTFLAPKVVDKARNNNNEIAIIQLSDLHFGKFVDLNVNKYNFAVAHQRLQHYLDEIIKMCLYQRKISDIYIAFTGDIFNLDSHMDSLLSNEDNRAENFLKGIDELKYFIDSLNQYFNVKVIGVIGNESRIRTTEYNSNINTISSNNFDMLAFQVLKRFYSNATDIKFINDCRTLHDVENIHGHNIAFVHGDKLKNHTKDDIIKFKMRLMEEYKCHVDYVIFGHLHETLITPTYARSGSLVGADEFAYNGLNISGSVASQNIYLVTPNEIRAMAIKVEER